MADTRNDADIARYLKTADDGHAFAQNILGDRYRTGKGITQDYGEAARWYRLAAEQGIPAAWERLGKTGRNAAGGA